MKIIVLDDEPMLLKHLSKLIAECIPEAEIFPFGDPDTLLEKTGEIVPEIAFLDIEVGYTSGMEIAKKIKASHPLCNIVFCTGYGEYAAQAFDLGASDYLLKPITAEKLRHALAQLRHPGELKFPPGRLFFRCFGEFEVFFDGKPLTTLPKRSKELLAYLVDKHGAICSSTDIIRNVFFDTADSYFRVAKRDLELALDRIGMGNVLIKAWGKLGIDKDLVSCDYYEYISGNASAVNLYKGIYMQQYPWAKKTASALGGILSGSHPANR